MSAEEFNRLKEDIKTNKFDHKYPIMLYENAILDGWNRYRACEELNITPFFDQFDGTGEEAMAFVMRSNKRRNLTDERLTALALQSDDMMKAIQKQVEEGRREKLHGNDNASKEKTTTLNSDSSISKDKNENTTDAKIAEAIGVKRNQVEKIKKLKKENPVAFEQVAAGKTTTRKLNAEKKEKLLKDTTPVLTMSADKFPDQQSEIIDTEENANVENKNTAIELSDAEILKLVRLAKNKVMEIAKIIVNSAMESNAILLNQPHFKAIEEIQLELGENLTGYKK
jgi:hypothetical protein